MEKLLIQGGFPLTGKIKAQGSKNASLPILAASLLASGVVTIEDVPDLLDVRTMAHVLKSLGAAVEHDAQKEIFKVKADQLNNLEPPPQLVRRMRASFLVLGPLLARYGRVRLALPGGCAIGTRPVDLHLKGLSSMGAALAIDGGVIEATAKSLQGARIYLDYPSVGATENIIMAATLARGITVLENAATEPEIVDLANFLNSMGACVSGAGTAALRVEGVEQLRGTRHTVIPDRIEAGTLLIAGVITGGDVTVENVLADHLKPLLAKLKETGAHVEEIFPCSIRAAAGERSMAVDLKTLPYPGFPTDLQPQFMALLAVSEGNSLITETVFENRFRHVEGLMRMGARIHIDRHHAVIHGQRQLTGSPVSAPDLRAGAALVLAALAAEGSTEISEAYRIERGYSCLHERLSGLGARLFPIYEEPYQVYSQGG